MSKVSVMGTFTCHDGKAEKMEAVLAEMVEAAGTEPGVEIYSYHRGDGNTFWFFALMADEESMQNHGRSEAMRAAMAAFGPLVAQPPVMKVVTPIAALGLNLKRRPNGLPAPSGTRLSPEDIRSLRPCRNQLVARRPSAATRRSRRSATASRAASISFSMLPSLNSSMSSITSSGGVISP